MKRLPKPIRFAAHMIWKPIRWVLESVAVIVSIPLLLLLGLAIFVMAEYERFKK